MAPKSLAASEDVREQAVVDTTAPAAANDIEPFQTTDVTAELSLRARVAPSAETPHARRAVAG